MASKWEKQVLAGLGMLALAGVIFYFGNMPQDEYKFSSFSIIPVIGGVIFLVFGIWTKYHSLS